MKGLLLKDIYMTWKYCRAVFLIMLVFFVIAAMGEENIFFLFYPMVIASIVPTTILSYDEKSGWLIYSEALPYSRAQLVSVKYVMAGALVAVVWFLVSVVQMVRIAAGTWEETAFTLSLLLPAALVSSSMILPVMFKYGVEKGRFAYYFVIALVCGGSLVLVKLTSELNLTLNVQSGLIPVMAVAAGIVIFAISWLISVRVYQNREI